MRWFNSNLKDSVLALLGGGELSPAVLEDRTEDIRLFILMELGEFAEMNYPKLVRNITYAQDAQSLWYARGEVMAVLADMHGETIAREKIAARASCSALYGRFTLVLQRWPHSKNASRSSTTSRILLPTGNVTFVATCP
jgi:hypothetical protein